MSMRSSRVLLVSLLACLASAVLPNVAAAQGGWRGRLTRAAAGAAGVGGVVEAVHAVRAAKGYWDARKTPTPIAGTYRFTYTINGSETQTIFVRTLDKPDMPLVEYTEGTTEQADFTKGYLMNLLVAHHVDSLPADWAAFKAWADVQRRAMEDAKRAREAGRTKAEAPVLPPGYVGGGWFRITRDSVDDEHLGRYGFVPGAFIFPRTAQDSAFWQRIGDPIGMIGATMNAQNAAANEGMSKAAQREAGMIGGLATIARPDDPIVASWAYRNGEDRVQIDMERISTVAIQRP